MTYIPVTGVTIYGCGRDEAALFREMAPRFGVVPTITEAGVPGFEILSWFALVAPAGTPQAIIGRLNAEAVKVLARDDVKGTLGAQGLTVYSSTPEQVTAHIKSELAKFTRIARAANIRAE